MRAHTEPILGLILNGPLPSMAAMVSGVTAFRPPETEIFANSQAARHERASDTGRGSKLARRNCGLLDSFVTRNSAGFEVEIA